MIEVVDVHDFRISTKHQPLHLDHCLLSIPLRAVGVLFWKAYRAASAFLIGFNFETKCMERFRSIFTPL